MKKSEWYEKRNNRINHVDGIKLDYSQKLSICIVGGIDCINSYSGQVMLLVSINIFTRWYNSLTVNLTDDASCLIPNNASTSLKDTIKGIFNSNDPFGNFNFSNETPEKFDLILCIGSPDSKIKKPYYWIDAENWISGFGYGIYREFKKNHEADWNPIGASFAACLGASAIFERVIKSNESVQFTKYYSLFDFKSSENLKTLSNPIISKTLDIGKICQVGCGAVGSSFNYFLSLLNVSGFIHLIDFDFIEVENLCSSLLFKANDAIEKRKKVHSCKHFLDKIEGIEVEPHESDYSEYIAESNYFENYPDLILCFANERNIWSTIQHNQPPIVYHATTTPNWGINFGRHIPFKEWCIVCRFGTVNYEYTPVCSNVKISNESDEKEVFGVLPFLSPAGAILTLAELIKFKNYSNYPVNDNFTQFMFKVGAEFRSLQMEQKSSCPICSTQEIDDYSKNMKEVFLQNKKTRIEW